MNVAGWLATLILIGLLGFGGFAWYRAEGEAPRLEAPERLMVGRAGAALEVAIRDDESGLRSLRVVVAHPEGEEVLLDETYPGNLLSGGVRSEHETRIPLEPERLADVGEEAVLRITVRDWSWRGGLGGNETLREAPLRVDLEPPRIAVHSGLTYVSQGGSGSVAYRVSEPVARDGVRVGEVEYRGHPVPGGREGERIALFAIPPLGDPKAPVRVFARDEAGNTSEARWAVVLKPRELPEARVQLSDSFLETVVPRLAPVDDGDDLTAAFHDVNTRIREQNERRIRELIAESDEEFHLRGRLRQMAGSKVTSRFGEQRSYWADGRLVSRAVHYGYDLASFAAAPVTAAGAGRVVFAGELGIYGGCVLIDHGLGLTTLYGHLSRIDVEKGDRVKSEQRLGLSGATGLAGGDHLHFAVLVGDTYVDPLEWWDPNWVKTHVEVNLRPQVP